MAWRDRLRKSSFRGVSFFVDSSELAGGRRVANHEFPGREDPYSEDLGRKQRSYPITAYIIGPDYFRERDALITACETEGSGQLVHPYYGTKLVRCESFRISESRSEGGIVTFSMELTEAGTKPSPRSSNDLLSSVQNASANAKTSLAAMLAAFDAVSQAGYLIDSAIETLNDAADSLSSASRGLTAGAVKIANLAFAIRNFKSSAAELIGAPNRIAAVYLSAMDLLKDALTLDGLLPEDNRGAVINLPDQKLTRIKTDRAKRAAYGPLLAFVGPNVTTRTTAARRQEDDNQKLLETLVRGAAAADLAEVATQTVFGTSDEAIAQREELLEVLDGILSSTVITDDAYAAIQDLTSAIVAAIPDPEAELPKLLSLTLPVSTPSLVLAYKLYRSADLEADLILRNRIKNPAFIPANRELEVLSNG